MRNKRKTEILFCTETTEEVRIATLLEGIEGTPEEGPRIFISYAREDASTAKRLFSSLSKQGARPWLDEKNLKGGQDWALEIKNALEKADLVLFLASKQSEGKTGVVQQELRFALDWQKHRPDGSIYLVPLKIEECKFSQKALEKYHWIEMYPDWEEGMFKIWTILREK